jgi:hypothetical protein
MLLPAGRSLLSLLPRMRREGGVISQVARRQVFSLLALLVQSTNVATRDM